MVVRFYSSTAAETTLSGTINSSATTVVVASVTGFPTSYPYTVALDYEGASEELVDVTAAAGTSLTVTRGVDGTAATGHNANARVRHVSSARDFRDSRTHENNVAGVHGVTGNVVGTSDTQSLTNKTLVSATGTLNRVDILSTGGGWVTTVNGVTGFTNDIMSWKQDPSATHPVALVTNSGGLWSWNANAGADSVFNTYRIRIVKNNGSTDIFSVLSGGSVVAWTDTGQTGFTVKPRSATDSVAFNVRNVGDTVDTFRVYNNGRTDILGSDPAFSQLDVVGAPAQSANFIRVMDSTQAQVLFGVGGSAKSTAAGTMDVRNDYHSGGTGSAVLRVYGKSPGQTGNLQEWYDQDGTLVAFMDATGHLEVAQTQANTTTVLAAASGFSINADTTAIKKNGWIIIRGAVTRTGADIAVDSSGNIGDLTMCTVQSAWRPDAGLGAPRLVVAYSIGDNGGTIGMDGSTGIIQLLTANNSNNITTGQIVRFVYTYPA